VVVRRERGETESEIGVKTGRSEARRRPKPRLFEKAPPASTLMFPKCANPPHVT
jgi:hypothetical protein